MGDLQKDQTNETEMEKIDEHFFDYMFYFPPIKTGRRKLFHQIFNLFSTPSSSKPALVITIIVLLTILVSTLSFIISTLPMYYESTPHIFDVIDDVAITIFTVDFVIRIITCPNIIKFCKDPLNWVDLIAILPFYIGLILGSSNQFTFVRVIRAMRVFRILKLGKYTSTTKMLTNAIVSSGGALYMLAFFLLIGLTLFASVIWFAEQSGAYFDTSMRQWIYYGGHPSPFQSIIDTYWLTIVTFTTVGYGDVVPITGWGKLICGMAAVCGVLILGFPITILGANIQDSYNKQLEAKNRREFKRTCKTYGPFQRIEILEKKCNDLEEDIAQAVKLVNELKSKRDSMIAALDELKEKAEEIMEKEISVMDTVSSDI